MMGGRGLPGRPSQTRKRVRPKGSGGKVSPERRRVLDARRGPRAVRPQLPFIGCDAEGGNIDGKHELLLLRCGNHVLETGKPLTTEECLGFLADLPKDGIYVGYFFGYDVTMICKDLPDERKTRLMSPEKRTFENASGREITLPVEWNGFEIDWEHERTFMVRRVGIKTFTTIQDVGSLFQQPFARLLADGQLYGAIPSWVADEPDEGPRIRHIAEMKVKRSMFSVMTDEEREYNAWECDYLSRLMEKFRTVVHGLGLRPNSWTGPGYIAAAFFRKAGFPKYPELDIYQINHPVLQLANDSYYGGRFEMGMYGEIKGTIYHYDIRSAYPSAYRELPCLIHGTWKKMKKLPQITSDKLFVAEVRFKHRGEWVYCTLPVRTKDGTLIWPYEGRGTYWSYEIQEARRQGVEVEVTGDIWYYDKKCDCQPFGKIEGMYEERKRIGKNGRGMVLKLILNSIYGKTAQSIGHPAYANPIWASLITSITRAKVNVAVNSAHGGDDVIMIATDGFACLEPRPDLIDDGKLGSWESETDNELLAIQSGVYISPKKFKTRGVGYKEVENRKDDLYTDWRRWSREYLASDDPTSYNGPPAHVILDINLFTGMKIAVARGKPSTSGEWITVQRVVQFDWRSKRDFWGPSPDCEVLYTVPLPGAPDLVSIPYGKVIGGKSDWQSMENSCQPSWGEILG